MASRTRALDRAAWLTRRHIGELGDEFHERRMQLTLSQGHVAGAARLSRTRYGLIERGKADDLSASEINRVAVVLGLSPSVRVYPEGVPIRDEASARRLNALLALTRPPLTWRTEAPLPTVEGRAERRAWDAVLFRGAERCAIELEMRLRDIQASLRKIQLKRRDDPTEAFLLLVADTRHNRRVIAEFAALLHGLPRLRPSRVRAALAAGELPPTGLLLI